MHIHMHVQSFATARRNQERRQTEHKQKYIYKAEEIVHIYIHVLSFAIARSGTQTDRAQREIYIYRHTQRKRRNCVLIHTCTVLCNRSLRNADSAGRLQNLTSYIHSAVCNSHMFPHHSRRKNSLVLSPKQCPSSGFKTDEVKKRKLFAGERFPRCTVPRVGNDRLEVERMREKETERKHEGTGCHTAYTQQPNGGEAVVSQLQLYWWRGGFARVCRLKGRAACRARESIGRQEVSAWFSGNNFAPTRRLSGMRSTATTATVLRELKHRSFYFLC